MSRKPMVIHILPNIITSGNLFAGFFAVLSISVENYFHACLAIFLAAIFDLFDGRVARMTNSDSAFGVEYDSLCDLVSFGMAPSFLMYEVFLQPFGRVGIIASFMIVLCAALRLARFNIQTGKTPKSYFVGLPVPLAAFALVGFYLFFKDYEDLQYTKPFALGICFSIGALMVSRFRFPSFKEFNPRKRSPFQYIALAAVVLGFLAMYPEETLFFAMAAYVLICFFFDLIRIYKRKKVS